LSYAEKKRSFIRRHSSRGKRTKHSPGHDSPRLDRHPSLRFSTTRLPSGRVAGQRPQPIVKACTLAVTTPPASIAGEAAEVTDGRKESSGSNASSIGTCHDLRPSVSAFSMTLHPERNRSLSSASDTGAVGAVEGPTDEVAQRNLAGDDQGVFANRAMDVSHINLLYTTSTSEHELSGSRRRLEDGLDVHPSNTVDRLSPASCRRRHPTADASPVEGSDHRRDVHLHPAQVDATVPGTEGPTDLVLIGVSILALLLLTSPTMVVGLVVAMCTGYGGSHGRPVSVDVAFSLHVVAYLGALLRPIIYYTFSRTLRQSLTTLLRCRHASNQHSRSAS